MGLENYTFIDLRFGKEYDPGWDKIVEDLCEKIQQLNLPNDFKIVQIKEKFGGLRVYTNYTTDELQSLIRKAEELSFKTCEHCGEPGKLRNRGSWLYTACDKHVQIK